MVHLFSEGPKWRLKSWKFDAEGKVRLKGARKLYSIERIFESIAENTTFFLSYGLAYRHRFLTDLPAEVLMLEDPSSSENLRSSSANMAAFNHLRHSLPVLASLDLDEVLQVRREDRDSFAAYQFAISEISKAALQGTVDEKNVQEVFRANLLPSLIKLKKELATEEDKTKKYLGFGAVGLLASVVIGAYGLPLLGAIPLATVSTGLLGKGLQRVIEVKPEAKQKNDLYFLVRLMEQAGLE